MMRRILVSVAVAGAALSLQACASGARPEAMTVLPSTTDAAAPGDVAYKAMRVQAIAGGEETNPLLASNVSNTELKTALEASLAATGYFNVDGPYALTATMVELKQPLAGLDFTVISRIRYSVVDGSGALVFDETVAASGTGKMSEALMGVERLRIANEASVRENIKEFIQRFKAKTKA